MIHIIILSHRHYFLYKELFMTIINNYCMHFNPKFITNVKNNKSVL